MNPILARAGAPMRLRLRDLLERPGTQHTVMAPILVNAALLGLATWPAAKLAAGGLLAMRALGLQIERISVSLAADGSCEGATR